MEDALLKLTVPPFYFEKKRQFTLLFLNLKKIENKTTTKKERKFSHSINLKKIIFSFNVLKQEKNDFKKSSCQENLFDDSIFKNTKKNLNSNSFNANDFFVVFSQYVSEINQFWIFNGRKRGSSKGQDKVIFIFWI